MGKNFLLLAFCFVLACGCSGQPTPEGMPKLVPAKLKFTQDGQPLASASITLISSDAANLSWPAGGTTDESGTLVVKTRGKYEGAAAGKYKIVVSKTETVGGAAIESSDDPDAAPAESDAESFYLIEATYRSADTTTLEVEIGSGGANPTEFSVGSAVREEIPKSAD